MTRWCVALFALIAAALPAAAQEQSIGQINTATGTVSVTRGAQTLPLKVGDQVYQKDVVQTGKDSSAGITFVDNSVFSTGPESRLALDQFHFDSGSFKGDMLAKLQKGTLTVVSGDIARSAPGNMKIQTPTAILGVRGTTFAIEVH
ncbi:MAG: FecR domain-containing protein [Alphaproteobacteria bacterium]|nr:FecR domain-containing protein [Alphaproteobacteria bacterium]